MSTTSIINRQFLEKAQHQFNSDPSNTISKNAVTCVGAYNAALDSDKANRVTHIFLNTLKPHNLRATNQEASGRCWMFAGLNVYRYLMIRALGLERFEFSETYLFFYDKLERANYLIQYFIDHPEADPNGRVEDILLRGYYTDGGYWNFFSNLINKYGLIPKDAMEETFHSGWSEDMNAILNERILSCINKIMELQKSKRPNKKRIQELRDTTMNNVYECLVKFLGKPPEKFDWYFEDSEGQPQAITGYTPHRFYEMIKSVNAKDFVVLVNIPGREYYRTYAIRNCNNMVGGDPCVVLNLPIDELKKYASKSIEKGLPVWFAGDVSKGFGYHKSVLDEKIYNTDLLFGSPQKWNKEQKLRLGFTEANHAMTLTGVNYDEKGNPLQWQVENSWGYFDHETPGLDGFMTMSNQWFEDNLVQISVNRHFLSRNIEKCLDKEPEVLEPWDFMAPAIKVKGVKNPLRKSK